MVDDYTNECNLLGKDGEFLDCVYMDCTKHVCSSDFKSNVDELLQKFYDKHNVLTSENVDTLMSLLEYSTFNINGSQYAVTGKTENFNGNTYVYIQKTGHPETIRVTLSEFLLMVATGISSIQLETGEN